MAYGPSAAAISRVSLVRIASSVRPSAAVAQVQERQRAQHAAALGGVAVAVELGELALGRLARRDQQQRTRAASSIVQREEVGGVGALLERLAPDLAPDHREARPHRGGIARQIVGRGGEPLGCRRRPRALERRPQRAGVEEAFAHVTDLRAESRRASGHSAATPSAAARRPVPASSAACSGTSPSTPPPTARCRRCGKGLRAARA